VKGWLIPRPTNADVPMGTTALEHWKLQSYLLFGGSCGGLGCLFLLLQVAAIILVGCFGGWHDVATVTVPVL